MKLTKTKLDISQLATEETLFHTANGYLGVRANFEEGYPENILSIRGCYINGFYDTVPLHYSEKLYGFPETAQRMVNLPDAQTMYVFLEEEPFSLFEGTLLEYRRELDTDTGTAHRFVHWRSPLGKEVKLHFTRMVSQTRQQLFFTALQLESINFSGNVRIESIVNCNITNFVDRNDPRVASDSTRHIFLENTQLLEDGGLALCHTGISGLGLAVCQRHTAKGAAVVPKTTESGFTTTITAALSPGQTLQTEKYTCYADSRRYSTPGESALLAAQNAVLAGRETILSEQADFLRRFWASSRVEIYGNEEMAQGMDFSLYQLLQSAGRDSISNVSAKGLSGEGYEGHYFWDTEIYILPFFLFTQPELAKKLLDFRYSILDNARNHACTMGHKNGALYPWRTITGSECSSYFPSGSAQYHLNGDVAHSFIQYWYATGDIAYMAEKGCEVLIETARLWLCAGFYSRSGQFMLPCVTGPDEYTCIVNNNFYTNLCAKFNLKGAVEVYTALQAQNLHHNLQDKLGITPEELAQMQHAAENMLLLYDEKLDINPQDDSFLEKPLWNLEETPKENFPLLLHYHPLYLYRHQVCKQPDTVLAHFLFEDGIDKSTIESSYNYYEKITTHDSSLSTCVFSIMAARLGNIQKAFDYYRDTVRTDLDNSHGNTKDGLHTANLGGAWLALTAGFGGLRLKPNALYLSPSLPAGWEGYRFSLRYHGSLLHINVTPAGIEVQLAEGMPVSIVLYGTPVTITGYYAQQRRA